MPGMSVLRAAVVALVVLGAVRMLEVGMGLPDRSGGLPVSAVLVLLVAAVLLRIHGRPAIEPGLPGRPAVRRALLVGGVGIGVVQVGAHGLAVAALIGVGEPAAISVAGENPATKSTAIGQVIGFLIFGVVVAAVGEELLFRGVLLDALAERVSFWRANGGQAVLFGLWHLVWPAMVVLETVSAPIPLAAYAAGFVVVTGVVGGIFATLRWATGTLWTPVLAHGLHNLVALFVHVETPAEPTAGSLVAAGQVLGYVVLAGWTWHATVRGL